MLAPHKVLPKLEQAVETLHALREKRGEDWVITTVIFSDTVLLAVASAHFYPSDIRDIEEALEDVFEDFCIHVISAGGVVLLLIDTPELEEE